ncbi:MAG: 4a-hydroxytetrahydrobiopterin dehydratase [Chlamydiae bacterium]|nr:4a-hydroxytetrahydrobiopterin dehydratase [Chlamydiota bacterium]
MENLLHKKCLPCSKSTPPLQGEALAKFCKQLPTGWDLIDNKKIEKIYKFSNFCKALAFTNKLGALAEEESHHPDITLSWGRVHVTLWTHKIGGLSENDFILAAKCESAYLLDPQALWH